MTLRRLLAGLIAAVLLAGSAALVVPGPASAATKPELTVTQANTSDKPATATYGPIPAAWTASRDAVTWTPSGCYTTGPGTAVCDTTPINVVPPTVSPDTDWYIDIEVSWPNPTGTNDLDIELYDNQQVSQRNNTTGFTTMGSSASSSNPEKIRAWLPTLGKYNLVVMNYLGTNISYTIKVTMAVGEKFIDPFESLEDVPPPDTSGAEDATAPEDAPADLSTFEEDFGSFEDFAGLEDLTSTGDSDLTSDVFGNDGEISDLPSAPPAVGALGNIAASRPGPASGMLMFIWLVLLPALAIGGVATFITTRSRRSAFGL